MKMEDLFSCVELEEQEQELSPFPEPEPEPEVEGEASTATGGVLLYPHPESAGLSCSIPAQKLRPIRPNAIKSNSNPKAEEFTNEEDEDELSATQLVKIKSEMDAHFISTLKSQFSHLLHLPFSSSSFSSSSDGSGESAAAPNQSEDRKRSKRNKRRKVELFLESLMAQVIHKQEQMHQQLMDMIERKERERISRELAWRQQELDRATKEEELRSKEAARSLALISLIHKTLNHPLPQHQQELDPKFPSLGSITPVWQQVSVSTANMGYIHTAKICTDKCDNINNKESVSGKKPSETANAFHELQTLYRNQLIPETNAKSPTDEHAFSYGKEIP